MPIQIEKLLSKLQDTSARNRLLKYRNDKFTPANFCFKTDIEDFQGTNDLFKTAEDLKYSISLIECDEDKEFKDYFVENLSSQKRIKIAKELNLKTSLYKKQRGLHILFLTIGEVVWKEDDKSFNSPLILVPVQLKFIKEKGKLIGVDFTIDNDEEVLFNPALIVKFEIESSYDLKKDLYDNMEEIKAVAKIHNLQCSCDLVKIGIYPGSSNYPIWKQLRENLDTVRSHEIVSKLLNGEFEEQPDKDDSSLDDFIFENPNFTVTNADDSQLSVIRESINGKNLVVIGPPGTGKSQTIVNILNALAVRGKKILFVCDKLTALEVVKKRLDQIEFDGTNPSLNLGDFCLCLFDSVDIVKSSKQINSIIENDRNLFNDDAATTFESKSLANLQLFYDKINKIEEKYGLKYKEIVGLVKKYENSKLIHISGLLEIGLKNPNDDRLKVLIERIKNNYELFKNPIQNIWNKCIDETNLPTGNQINVINSILAKLSELDQKLNKSSTLFDDLEINDLKHLAQQDMSVLPSDIGNLDSINKNIQLINGLEHGVSLLERSVAALHLQKDIEYNKILEFEKLNFKIIPELQDLKVINLENLLQKINQLEVGFLDNFEVQRFSIDLKDLDNISLLDVKKLKLVDCLNLDKIFENDNLTLLTKILTNIEKNCGLLSGLDLSKYLFNLELYEEDIEADLTSISDYLPISIRFIAGIFSKKYDILNKNIRQKYSFNDKLNIEEIVQILTQSKLYFNLKRKETALKMELSDLIFNYSCEQNNEFLRLIKQINNNNISKNSIEVFKITTAEQRQNSHKYIIETQSILHLDVNCFRSLDDYFLESKNIISELIELCISITKIQKIVVTDFLRLSDLDNICSKIEEIKICIQKIFRVLNCYSFDNLDSTTNYQFTEINKIFEHKELEQITYLSNVNKTWQQFRLGKDFNESKLLQLSLFKDSLIKNNTIQVKQEIEDLINQLRSENDIICTIENVSNLLNSDLSSFVDYLKCKKLLNEDYSFSKFIDNCVSKNISQLEIYNYYCLLFYKRILLEIDKEFGEFGDLVSPYNLELFKESANKITTTSQSAIRIDIDSISNQSQNAFSRFAAMSKKPRMPTRSFLTEYKESLLRVKPIWLANPVSISSYLPFIENEFDVVVFDEASQLELEYSILTIARAKQVIIFGDPHQLPPTNIFKSLNSELEDENNDFELEDESLMLAAYNFIPNSGQFNLSYHYRSKFSELIEFSNNYVYKPRNMPLEYCSSSDSNSNAIEYHYLANGLYKDRCNEEEVIKLIEILIDLVQSMIKTKEYKTIGIITLNSQQEAMLRDEITKETSNNPQLFALLTEVEETPLDFFIKSTDSVQGDERDIIFISTVYDNKDQRFGYLDKKGSYKRLNVILTRAKEKIILVTSLKSSDIQYEGEEIIEKGSLLLKRYLSSVEQNNVRDVVVNEPVFDSPFEESVFHLLGGKIQEIYPDITIDTQVGESKFRIDLAIKHNGKYILGIECDGLTYHSGASIREKDMIRQSILESKGWVIHRIWSFKWLESHENEVNKVLKLLKNLVDKS